MKHHNTSNLQLLFITLILAFTMGIGEIGYASEKFVGESMPSGIVIPLYFDPLPKPNYVAPPQEFLLSAIQASTITVNFLAAGATQHGYTCQAWPANAQTAFNYAASIAQSLVNSAVTIRINACWADLGGGGLLGLGGATTIHRNFSGAPQTNTWYYQSLANALHGSDLDAGNPDILTTYNSVRTDWYLGTDGIPQASKLDFVSVVLHEIWHGLNFAGSMTVSSGLGYWGWGDCGNPSIYDRFTEYGASSALLGYTCGSASLASALTSNNIFFDGANANAANGGSHVSLYAPGTWAGGSSYSHLGESYNGTPNALMTYSIGYNEANHNPGPVGRCLLKDIGWTINGTCGTSGSIKIHLPLILKNYGGGGGTCPMDSQFNGSGPGWVSHSGDWYIGGSYLYTSGLDSTSSSASFTTDFGDFDYQASMLRLGCDVCANRIIFRGTPSPLTAENNWYHEYKLQYSRDGNYSVYKRVAGGTATAIVPWTATTAINQGDSWNTLRVVANGTSLSFYINGVLLWSGSDSSLSNGLAGLGMYRDTSTGNELRVDWARLCLPAGASAPAESLPTGDGGATVDGNENQVYR
jgi:hypothetical protein